MNILFNLILTLLKLFVLLSMAGIALGFGLCGSVSLLNAFEYREVNWGIVLISLVGFSIMWGSARGFWKLAKRFFPGRSGRFEA
ncbi:MAG: hypothetical protein ACKN9W_19590 [Methylococcus sp.]